MLYDAPPFLTEDAVARIREIGTPRLLVVSHRDFVGLATDWADEAVASMAGSHPRPAALPRSLVVEYAAPARPGAAVTGSAWALPSGSIALRLVEGDQELVRAVVEPID